MAKESKEAQALRERLEDSALAQIQRTIPASDCGGRIIMAVFLQDSINHTVEHEFPAKQEEKKL